MPGTAEYEHRLERLRAWLAERRLDVAYVSSPPNIAYLAGFAITPYERLVALVIPQKAEPVLVVPELEKDAARANSAGIEIIPWRDEESPYARVRRAFERIGRTPISLAVEKDTLTLTVLEGLENVVDIARLDDSSSALTELRLRKTNAELALMQRAADIIDGCLADVPAILQAGRAEAEIALDLERMVRSRGAEAIPFDTTVLAGANAALPHGQSGSTRTADGDLVIVDVGAKIGGYCADVARTFAVGDPGDRAREVFGAVQQAQENGVNAVAPGVTCGAVDTAVRSTIEAAGYGKGFIHRTGHGLGLEVHEPPSLAPGNDRALEPRMVVTVEPGIYLPGFGGVRIEDDVVVTDEGRRRMTMAPRDLLVSPS